jgi:site-specific recombinase XerC
MAIVPPPASTPTATNQAIQLDPRLAEAIRDVLAAAESANTHRTYASQTGKFERWCRASSVAAFPATPATVAAYLVSLALDSRRVATVSLALAAIGAAHRSHNLPFDSRALEIRQVVRGIRRKFACPQHQAKPLAPSLVRAIVGGPCESMTSARDAALVGLLFCSALRRSELSGLDHLKCGGGNGILKITPIAIEITLLRAKSNLEPTVVFIPATENQLLVAALTRWIRVASLKPGAPVFPTLRKGSRIGDRLAPGGVSWALKVCIARHLCAAGWSADTAHAEASAYSGHSGRFGLYVAGAEAGVALGSIASLARHRGLGIAQRYSRKADLLRRAPSLNPALQI